MRFGRRRSGAAFAVVLAVVLLTLATLLGVRWNAAAEPKTVVPPGGATAFVPGDDELAAVVGTRAGIIALWLRNDRGEAIVRTYALPPGTPWLQARKLVATQLDHWEQIGDCADDPASRLLECGWREPTRWWPREVQLTMMRPPPAGEDRNGWPELDILIIGAGRGA